MPAGKDYDPSQARDSRSHDRTPSMTAPGDHQAPLRNFPRTQDFFVAIDSDGCVFDTMEVKHKECFIPHIVRFFELAAISKYAREVAEFVNLYSRWRGINRFPGLVLTLDLLAERPEVARRGFRLPGVPGLRDWVARETTLANSTLRAEVERTDDPDLVVTLQWSEAVNQAISEIVHDVPPFPFVRETLSQIDDRADVLVCSATPCEAVVREWHEQGIAPHANLIAGQELGSKREQLALAAAGRYDPDKILMVGDAPGDLHAAEANGVLFYPILPGFEEESWERLHDEALPRFLSGEYTADYMADQVGRFRALLPSEPPWKTR
jgi:phosphoglycolate phosphatase-like HAD superfamily hydrolase